MSLIKPWLQAAGRASQVAPVVKNPPASAGDVRDMPLISGSRRSSGGGHGNPLQDSCLENPMDRGTWWATVHGFAKSQTRLKPLGMHTRNAQATGVVAAGLRKPHGMPLRSICA